MATVFSRAPKAGAVSTAEFIQYRCLYTKHKTQKRKVYSEGLLKVQPSGGQRVILYAFNEDTNKPGVVIEDSNKLESLGNPFALTDTEIEMSGHLVQVNERWQAGPTGAVSAAAAPSVSRAPAHAQPPSQPAAAGGSSAGLSIQARQLQISLMKTVKSKGFAPPQRLDPAAMAARAAAAASEDDFSSRPPLMPEDASAGLFGTSVIMGQFGTSSGGHTQSQQQQQYLQQAPGGSRPSVGNTSNKRNPSTISESEDGAFGGYSEDGDGLGRSGASGVGANKRQRTGPQYEQQSHFLPGSTHDYAGRAPTGYPGHNGGSSGSIMRNVGGGPPPAYQPPYAAPAVPTKPFGSNNAAAAASSGAYHRTQPHQQQRHDDELGFGDDDDEEDYFGRINSNSTSAQQQNFDFTTCVDDNSGSSSDATRAAPYATRAAGGAPMWSSAFVSGPAPSKPSAAAAPASTAPDHDSFFDPTQQAPAQAPAAGAGGYSTELAEDLDDGSSALTAAQHLQSNHSLQLLQQQLPASKPLSKWEAVARGQSSSTTGIHSSGSSSHFSLSGSGSGGGNGDIPEWRRKLMQHQATKTVAPSAEQNHTAATGANHQSNPAPVPSASSAAPVQGSGSLDDMLALEDDDDFFGGGIATSTAGSAVLAAQPLHRQQQPQQNVLQPSALQNVSSVPSTVGPATASSKPIGGALVAPAAADDDDDESFFDTPLSQQPPPPPAARSWADSGGSGFGQGNTFGSNGQTQPSSSFMQRFPAAGEQQHSAPGRPFGGS